MYEIIKITETNGRKAVSARELHYFLESKQEFASWIKNRITKYDLIENEDFVRFDNIIKTTGGKTIEYALTLDAAKELSMVEGNAKGKQARKYFIEAEKELREMAQPVSRPISTLDMLELSIKQLRAQESRVDAIETKILEIEAKAATRPDYFTIVGYATLHKIQVGLKLASSLGKKASNICKAHNYPMEELPDPRFGRVRMYPAMVLQQVFEESLTHG